ncbi:MAG: rhomboid family intramembrane serine protease [Flavobacteriales bacterium]|mgnify:FL=1|jgi:membrane associated rhomboid family serine protease|nr:rhomboid family intramembrane serine protease [Flavobacteriales bacterium]
MYRQSFSQLPQVIKNLLIINGLFFLGTISLDSFEIDLVQLFGLHPFQSHDFMPHQLITHLFMHGDFTHLFFNMFALWMFGKILENVWGGKRFLTYYIITGLGAMILYSIVQQIQISLIEVKMTVEQIQQVSSQQGYDCYRELVKLNKIGQGLTDYGYSQYGIIGEEMKSLLFLYNTPVVGASGAVFGILLAFGMLFPNTLLYVFFAIPVKAKYVVLGYGLLELFLTITNSNDGIAHLAHIGGMIFGFFLIKYWNKNTNSFY